MAQSALQMSPNVNPSNVRVVFADQFFTQELIIDCGFICAKLFYDHYHLKLNQEKGLGEYLFGQVKDLLSSLMNANNHEEFVEISETIFQKFPGKPEIKDLVNKYKDLEEMFAAYVIDQSVFTMIWANARSGHD